MKTRILSLALIAFFAISTTAMAQQPERKKRNPEKREMMVEHREMKQERLNDFFTEEQLDQMKTLRLETARKVKPLRNQLNELEAKQQTLTTADKADLNAINSNIDKMSVIKADIAKIKAKQHQEIRSMLTEEQLIKFDEMKGRRGKPGKFEDKPMPGKGFDTRG